MKTIIGIDWSEQKHCVHLYNEAGALLTRFEIDHSVAGFAQLERQLVKVNPEPTDCLIAIETSHNLLVDFLVSRGYTLYVIAPIIVKNNRGRQSSSGAKDDDRDAQLLADILRTDRGRLIPWQADGPLVRQMRTLLSWVDDLTGSIVAQHNRLRANLLRYYPQPLTAFYNLKSSVALHFLAAFPAPKELESLTFAHFREFCDQHRYYRYDFIPAMFANLQKPAPTLDEEIVPAYRLYTVFLANQLLLLTKQKKAAIKQVNQLFDQHPDAFIFASVPGAGELLAPKMLVMFGDHRQHYPHRSVLPAIAGTSPVTVASGKSRYVKFRRGCNRRYRHTAQQLAQMSTRKSVWAASYFDQVCSRGGSKSHAYRCLANRWLHIIWTLWQKRQVYDEAYHLRQVARHRQPLEKAGFIPMN
jgi:transposase